MTLILSDKDVRQIADMAVVVDGLERGLRAEAVEARAVMPERMNLTLDSNMLRVMPAILPGAGIQGLKFFYGTMADGIRYTVVLSTIEGGEVLAVIDAAYLTALRTGATSGVATRLLSRVDSRTVGLIGSGLEAETNLSAVCAVRPIDRVRVFSRNQNRREEFAQRMSVQLGISIEAVDTPQKAVAEADIVVVATNTGKGGDVAFRGDWLSAGQHIVSIGSTSSSLREIDETTFLRPDVVVLDAPIAQMSGESGDIIALLEKRPDWTPSGVLDDALTGQLSSRTPEQITLFKSVGTAAQDLISALALYQVAIANGVGLLVPDVNEPKAF